MNRLIVTTLAAGTLLGLTACNDDDAGCDPETPGIICTIAGNGENGYDRDADNVEIPALETKFSLPQDTLTTPDGTLYLLDWNNHRLRELTADGMVKWVAGRGELGGSLDDPENGDFNHPTNIILDQTGTKVVMAAWHNSKIREVDRATGAVEDSCGDGKRAYFGDDGPALTSSLDLPASIAYDPAGNLVIMDQANQVLRFIGADDNIHLLAGRCVVDAPAPAGPGLCAEGVEPTACPDGPNGPSGKAVCGDPAEFCSKPCTPGYGGDEGPATQMRMSQPFGQSAQPAGRIVFDGQGNLYFADTGNHLIRMIDTDGIVHRVAGTAPVDGVPQSGYAGDGGPATEAVLNFPVDLAFGDDGTLYFSDVRNHCVRAIGPDGTIETAVGICGEPGYDGDGDDPTLAHLSLAFGVEFAAGKLMVADTGNNVIRSIVLP